MPRKNQTQGYLYELQEIPMSEVIEYQKHEVGETFVIRLKAPRREERYMDDHRHYTKSNINVCYAAPRSKGVARNWYETQLSVSKQVREKNGYPYRGIPFYVVTDDGFGFLAHTTSQNNKQFSAVGDELILGKWIKTRLVNEGLVKPVKDVLKDVHRDGMITEEMLDSLGGNAIAFQKTDLRIENPDNIKEVYEVWTLKLVQTEEE